jgi:CBS domain-containing protein
MAQLLVVILHDPAQLPVLLEAWQSVGLPGTTILSSAGAYRSRDWLQRVGLGTLSDLFRARETESRTLLSVIDDDDLLEKAIAVTEEVLGDLNLPGRGILFVVPIAQVQGIIQPPLESLVGQKPPPVEPPPFAPMTEVEIITRQTPVSVVAEILNLEPVIVQRDQSLLEVAEALAQNLPVNVACVVNEQQQLVGLLALQNLADDLFLLVVPEEFLSETRDVEDALHYADMSRTQTAGDAMIPPVSVTRNDQVRDAFRKMHDHKLSGIPIVNQGNEVTGYITLLELLVLYIRSQGPSSTNKGENRHG